MTHKLRRKPHKIKTKRSIFKTKSFWYVILVVVLLVATIYFVIFFDKVQIKNIIISGNSKAPANQIESLVANEISKKVLFLPERSIFLVDTATVKNLVLESFPVVGDVKVSRKFFDSLEIVINEREARAIFCQNIETENTCSYIDETGTAFEEAKLTETQSSLIVRRYDNNKVSLGEQAITKETLGYILKAKKGLTDKYGVLVDSADIASDIRLNIKTNEGWEVYFNLSADMDLQIAKLILLLEKEITKESRGSLQYIDLRFQDRAYYK